MRHPRPDKCGSSGTSFGDQFRVFENDAVGAAVHARAYFAIHEEARRRPAADHLFNTRPLFWASTVNGHQVASLAKLGKIFDQNSSHNIDRLIRAMKESPEVFSKAALAERKIQIERGRPEWLEVYMSSVHEPGPEVFRDWGKWVARMRATYQEGFRDLRHAFNHTRATTPDEWKPILARAEQRRLKVLIGSLLHLRREIEQLFWNGTLPTRPRRVRYSSRLLKHVGPSSPLEDLIVTEVHRITTDLLVTHRERTQKGRGGEAK